nr:hypothetical protein WMHIBSEC_WMHIBSEC_CDS_0028 [Caudoviricetes sp.]CAI9751721.1 hypothetical protein AZFZUZMX_AZFZUZMX_CDS_0028 [Caudoviricetes sp.]
MFQFIAFIFSAAICGIAVREIAKYFKETSER